MDRRGFMARLLAFLGAWLGFAVPAKATQTVKMTPRLQRYFPKVNGNPLRETQIARKFRVSPTWRPPVLCLYHQFDITEDGTCVRETHVPEDRANGFDLADPALLIWRRGVMAPFRAFCGDAMFEVFPRHLSIKPNEIQLTSTYRRV